MPGVPREAVPRAVCERCFNEILNLPAVRPDLAIKRNETKLILEKEVKLTLWMEELELNASLQALPGEAEAQEWSRRELW